jgi:hypothetical protein
LCFAIRRVDLRSHLGRYITGLLPVVLLYVSMLSLRYVHIIPRELLSRHFNAPKTTHFFHVVEKKKGWVAPRVNHQPVGCFAARWLSVRWLDCVLPKRWNERFVPSATAFSPKLTRRYPLRRVRDDDFPAPAMSAASATAQHLGSIATTAELEASFWGITEAPVTSTRERWRYLGTS